MDSDLADNRCVAALMPLSVDGMIVAASSRA
jgi:hypothetical protein